LGTVLLFFAAFALYLAGLSGTVSSYRDSGDLIASIYTLGIAHPPGYALYVLLGKLFVTVLPFGNVAYRVNVMSAFFAALTVLVLFRVLYRWGPPLGAFMVVLLYATSPAVMALARVAEMYTLSSCLAIGILWCLLSPGLAKGSSWAALLLGLGLSVHPTLIFLLPLFFISPHQSFTRSSALYLLLGLSVFLYLPIRASQHPLINWGDPSHWRNFWRVITRADYGGLKLHPEESVFSWTLDSIYRQLAYFLATLKGEWGWGGMMAGFAGIVCAMRDHKTRRWSVMLLVSWLLCGPGFFLLSNLPLEEATTPAILQPYLLLMSLLWAPFVMTALVVIPVKAGIHGSPVGSFGDDVKRRIMLGLLVIAMLVSRSWKFQSQRNDFYAYDYARNLLRSLPPGAVLYDSDDPTHFSIQVLQTLEKRRPDVTLLSFFRTRWGYEQLKREWPDLLPPISISSGQELQHVLWEYSARQRPFFADLPQKLGQIPYRAEGLVYAAQVSPRVDSEAQSHERAEVLLDLYVKRGDFVTVHHPDFFTRHLIDYYADAHCNLGLEYANSKNWEKAIGHYQAALAIDPELSAAYNDWGIVAFERQDYQQAFDLFQKGLVVDPKNEMLRKNVQFALQKMPKLL
jgi:hypothetical protein